MISFQGKEYELFFSNDIVPLQALTFAGEEFFEQFERLCGSRYRLLSVIKKGEQEKYGLEEDTILLKKIFQDKLKNGEWIEGVFHTYESCRTKFLNYLGKLESLDLSGFTDTKLSAVLIDGYKLGVPIAAVSNMLHMFSTLLGPDFLEILSKYGKDRKEINQNHIYYTQPLKESRFSKIILKKLKTAFQLSNEEQNWSRILRVGAYVKGDGSALFAKRVKIWQTLLREIASRLELQDPSDTLYLFPKEIENMIVTRTTPTKLISNRRELTVIFYLNRNMEIYEGQKADGFFKKGKFRVIIENKNEKILKGQPASPGKAKGRAVVTIGLNNALAAVRQGDILVTVYTSARYVPAMKKAAAIVTETGSITAHAAVVSRELGVPCVIAVRDVTKIIHTGDIVEVDADAGIVKILKS